MTTQANLGRGVFGLAISLGLALSACIALPDDQGEAPDSCDETRDCPSDQICLANQCYGDPPGGAFAIVVSPAGNNANASQAAYPNASISEAGELGTFALADTLELPGTLEANCAGCAGGGFQALLTLSQRAAFVGGPARYTAQPVEEAALSMFQFSVAAQATPAQTMSLAIVPTDTETHAWSTLVPGQRVALPAPLDTQSPLDIFVDGLTRRVVGRIVRSDAQPAAGFIVSAVGTFDANRAPERISAVVITDSNGQFSLPVSTLASPEAELVIAPSPQVVAPTYTLPLGLSATETIVDDIAVSVSPSTLVTVNAIGYASSGTKVTPEAGRVIIEAQFATPPDSAASLTFRAEVPLDASGPETLAVPTNAEAYFLTVIHAGAGEIGSLYRKPVSLAELQAEQVLPRRTSVVGTLTTELGAPVAGATLTLVPSVGTLWNQVPSMQALISEQAAASALTAPDGSYILWADTSWHGLGNWRLSIVPPEAAPAPMPRWATVLELGATPSREINIALPSASAAHARAVFPNGRPAQGARVTLYRVNSITPCLASAFAPASCELPEVVVASGITDPNGDVVLVIPNVLPAL